MSSFESSTICKTLPFFVEIVVFPSCDMALDHDIIKLLLFVRVLRWCGSYVQKLLLTGKNSLSQAYARQSGNFNPYFTSVKMYTN